MNNSAKKNFAQRPAVLKRSLDLPLQALVNATLVSALVYFLLEVANLWANVVFLAANAEAGQGRVQFFISFAINLLVTSFLYFWVYRLLRQGRYLGRLLGTIAAIAGGLGAILYALLVFSNALWLALFCIAFFIVNVLWIFIAWRKEVSELLS